MQLTSGQNAPISGDEITLAVAGPVDLTALVLSQSGAVSGDADMIFFNQPRGPGVSLTGTTVSVSLAGLRAGAEKVALVVSPEREDRNFGQLPPVTLTISHGAGDLTYSPPNLTTETALVLCELYRRNGAWKLRAVGQGYGSGLAGVAIAFGIEVDDEAAPPPVPPVVARNSPALASPRPAAVPAIDLTKKPLGAINLSKSGQALIPLTKNDKGKLRLRVSLRWTGRGHGESDLDLYALYIDVAGEERAVYYKDRGELNAYPFIQLDQDSRGAGEENVTVIAGHHRFVLLCAYSALGNGIGAFKSYGAHVVVDDGEGSQVTVPLYNKNKFSYWVAIALLDFTDPAGARVVQVEQYGKNFSERRPLLHADGSIEMSKGPIEFKDR